MVKFIQQAAQQLGIGESTSRALTGGLLGLIKQQAPAGDFGELLRKIPGVDALVVEDPAAPAGGGLTGLAHGPLTKAPGGVVAQAGAVLALSGLFKNAGVDGARGGKFVELFVEFLRKEAGGPLLDRLAGSVPALKAYVG